MIDDSDETPPEGPLPTDQGEPDEDPVEVEAAWAEEIQRRLDEYRAGTVRTIPASEVFAEARARLR